MKLTILSFDGKKIENDKVFSVTLLTKSWEITILDNHTPLITSVKPSTMYYIYKDENNIAITENLAVWNWVVEVSSGSVKVMLDDIIDLDKINVNDLQKAKQEAEKLMEKYKNSKDKVDMEKFIEAEDQLLKSIAWLKLYEIKK